MKDNKFEIEKWDSGTWSYLELNTHQQLIEKRVNDILNEKNNQIQFFKEQNKQLIESLTLKKEYQRIVYVKDKRCKNLL